jgi:hypothetical protein
MFTKFLSKSLMGRDHIEDIGICGRTILKMILKRQIAGVCDWIHLAQDLIPF